MFYIGGTKVGALFGEAVVIVNPALKTDFRYHVKQRGGMLAKGRLLGIQFDVLFTDNLYFEISKKAVRQALRIADAVPAARAARSSPILRRTSSSPFSRTRRSKSSAKSTPGRTWARVDDFHSAIRLCTSWATTDENVDALCADIASAMR